VKNRKIRLGFAALLTVSFAWLVSATAAAQDMKPTVTPETIRMGTFYSGDNVRVEGETGPGKKIIIVVQGGKAKEVFNKVGRVGPIWINTGKVAVSDVPSLLLVFSSEPISECLTRAAIDKYGLDRPAFKKQVSIESQSSDKDRIADDFFSYKVKRGSYQLAKAGVRMGQPDEDGRPYSLNFTMPKAAGPGEYKINVLECQGGDVVANTEVPIQIMEVGFPALISWLASKRPSTYGMISVVVAMLAGFGIDFLAARLFKRRIARH
jgi:Putative transmembrane protein (Alph_Pro_TM)